MNASDVARALGGEARGNRIYAPGPGHSKRDRSMWIEIGPSMPDGFTVGSFAGDDWTTCKDHVRAMLGLDQWEPSRPRAGAPKPVADHRRQAERAAKQEVEERRRRAQHDHAMTTILAGSRPVRSYDPAGMHFISRGLPVPTCADLRHHPDLRHRDGQRWPALVAVVRHTQTGERLTLQRLFLTRDGRKAPVGKNPRLILRGGHVRAGAVQLSAPGDTLVLTEGVEDAAALQMMAGAAAWATLGTANFRNVVPPASVRTIILAPDADRGGDAAVAPAATHFQGMGLRVMHLRPPDGNDWSDLVHDFGERAAIREFDGGQDRAEAELAAFAEVVGGSVADGD